MEKFNLKYHPDLMNANTDITKGDYIFTKCYYESPYSKEGVEKHYILFSRTFDAAAKHVVKLNPYGGVEAVTETESTIEEVLACLYKAAIFEEEMAFLISNGKNPWCPEVDFHMTDKETTPNGELKEHGAENPFL